MRFYIFKSYVHQLIESSRKLSGVSAIVVPFLKVMRKLRHGMINNPTKLHNQEMVELDADKAVSLQSPV